MTDWRLFISTFGLILIAELGDKTQLTVLAASAGSRSPFAIFLGASAALVFSVGLAVIIGFYLQKNLPLQAIQFAAGLVFLLFGVISIYKSMKPGAHILASSAQFELPTLEPSSLGFLSRFTLQAALDFEKAATNDYAKLAEEARHPRVKTLFQWLAREDGKHHDYIKGLTGFIETLPPGESLLEVVRPQPEAIREDFSKDALLLRQSIKHEESAMAFYRNLSESLKRKTKVSRLFERLAFEEQQHLIKIHGVLREIEFKKG